MCRKCLHALGLIGNYQKSDNGQMYQVPMKMVNVKLRNEEPAISKLGEKLNALMTIPSILQILTKKSIFQSIRGKRGYSFQI